MVERKLDDAVDESSSVKKEIRKCNATVHYL